MPRAKKSWAQDVLNFKNGRNGDVTGSTGATEEKASEPALKVSDKPPDPPKLEVAGAAIPLEPGRIASPGERAVLERLQTGRHSFRQIGRITCSHRDLDKAHGPIAAADFESSLDKLKLIDWRL